jgi:ABC-type multidrug transport system fused ATPase/permease subunit
MTYDIDGEEMEEGLPEAPEDLEAEARVNPRVRAALEEVGRLKAEVERQRSKRKKAEKKLKGKKKGNLGTTRGIETMFRTSYRTHIDLSGLADTKANIMISINGIIISILLASISPKIDANPWLLLPTTVLLVGCVIAIVYAVLAARPRVSSSLVTLDDVRDNRANILFFGNFVSMPEDDFVEGMTELMSDTDRLYTNMIRDLYSLGGVLSRKFRLLRVSYNLFMASLVIGVALFISVFIGVVLFGIGPPLAPPL